MEDNKQNEEKMISIPESQLNNLLQRIENIEKGQGQLIKPKRVTERTAKMRIWNDKLVVGFTKVYKIFNEKIQDFEDKIELLLKDGDNTQKVEADYLIFLNDAEPVTVKILEQKADKKEIISGTSNLVDAKDDRIYPDKTIDMVVTRVEYTSKVEIIDGSFAGTVLTINNKFLNM